MNTARINFGRRLREQREHNEITLDEIATVTKIKRSLLAGLERGDLSGWPSGIFRRAFVREYAAAVGLPAESIVAEFVHLFPEPGTSEDAVAELPPANSLRLTLADDRRDLRNAAIVRAMVAVGEAGVISATAALLAAIFQIAFWQVCGAVALGYYAVATATLGRSPAAWYLNGGIRSLRHHPTPLHNPASLDARDTLYLVKRTELDAPTERDAEHPRRPVSDEPADAAAAPPLRAATR